MSKVFIMVLLLTVGAMGLQAGSATTLEEAKTLSEKTGKPILMDFMTEW